MGKKSTGKSKRKLQTPPPESKRGRWFIPLVLFAVGGGAIALVSNSGATGPSVLIISVDTLRPDHMSCYGYSRSTTPRLDELAREGILFEEVITPRPKTTPSMITMLTGLYPHHHGIRTNFAPLPGVQLRIDPMQPLRSAPFGPGTLAERLQKEGMATGGLVSNFVLTRERSGLQRGFDQFDDELTSSERLRKNIKERKATDSTDRAIRWLEDNGDDPFFLWVHYIDPHGSYDPPSSFLETMRNEPPAPLTPGIPNTVPVETVRSGQIVTNKLGARIFVAQHNLLPNPSSPSNKTQTYLDAYDAEILYMDHEVGRLLDALKDQGLDEHTLVIFTADHGESLGEHSCYFEHGFYIYEASSWIPLIVRAPTDVDHKGRRITEVVDLLDVYPTVIDWLGLESEAERPGLSLLDTLTGGRPPPGRISYIERNEYSFNMRAVRTTDWKLIYNFQVPSAWPIPAPRELYDLRVDPHELNNLYGSADPDIIQVRQDLERNLLEWARASGDLRSFAGEDEQAVRDLPQEARDRLTAMGYLNEDDPIDATAPANQMEEFDEAKPPSTATPRDLLTWALGDRPDLRSLALRGLALYGGLSRDTLVQYLGSEHPMAVRCQAAELLAETKQTDSASTLAQLVESLPKPDFPLALTCDFSLARLGDKQSGQVLRQGLEHWNAAIRARAAWCAGELDDPRWTDALRSVLDDPVGEVRVLALHALHKLGAKDDVVSALKKEILDAARGAQPDEVIDPHTVMAAVLALADTGGADGLRDLAPKVSGKKNRVLFAALTEAQAWALPDFARVILKQLPSVPAVQRRRLLNAVASRIGEESREALLDALRDDDVELRIIAAVHLLRLEAGG